MVWLEWGSLAIVFLIQSILGDKVSQIEDESKRARVIDWLLFLSFMMGELWLAVFK